MNPAPPENVTAAVNVLKRIQARTFPVSALAHSDAQSGWTDETDHIELVSNINHLATPLAGFADVVGWGGWIRTSAWRYQKPLPYRLATPQHRGSDALRALRRM
jgi:hypothetical protein